MTGSPAMGTGTCGAIQARRSMVASLAGPWTLPASDGRRDDQKRPAVHLEEQRDSDGVYRAFAKQADAVGDKKAASCFRKVGEQERERRERLLTPCGTWTAPTPRRSATPAPRHSA
jgi:hypothetical protein